MPVAEGEQLFRREGEQFRSLPGMAFAMARNDFHRHSGASHRRDSTVAHTTGAVALPGHVPISTRALPE